LRKLVAFIPASKLHLLPSLLPEVILSTKEANERSREAAFDLLVIMAQKMASGGLLDRSKVSGMDSECTFSWEFRD
jgi:ribosomal RNA-processing protein 12